MTLRRDGPRAIDPEPRMPPLPELLACLPARTRLEIMFVRAQQLLQRVYADEMNAWLAHEDGAATEEVALHQSSKAASKRLANLFEFAAPVEREAGTTLEALFEGLKPPPG